MNSKVYVFLTDGCEPVEALTPIDFLKRADVDVVSVGVGGKVITSSSLVSITADTTIDKIDGDSAKMMILPGGPGASNLAFSEPLQKLLLEQYQQEKYIAAICASPVVVLSPLGILNNKQYTCFQGMEKACEDSSATFVDRVIVRDEHIITSRSVATAAAFSLYLVSVLAGFATAKQVWNATMLSLTSKLSFDEILAS